MEYKVLQLSLIAMETAINTLAADGWRVISISPNLPLVPQNLLRWHKRQIGAYATVVLERPRTVGPRETK